MGERLVKKAQQLCSQRVSPLKSKKETIIISSHITMVIFFIRLHLTLNALNALKFYVR